MSAVSKHLVALVAVAVAFWPSASVADDDDEAPKRAKPAITKLTCENLKIHVAWAGTGVAVVDYYAPGSPVLQTRQDPTALQTSTDVDLEKYWGGRRVDVRIWDENISLLDTKSVDCKATP